MMQNLYYKSKNIKYLASIALVVLLAVSAYAQSGPYNLDDEVQNFSLKDGSGKRVSLNQYATAKAVVIVFTNNRCPYSRQYENRLVQLATSYGNQGVQFVFINPSVGTAEGGERLQDLAAKKYPFPYLADEGQQVTNQFGATKTPEAFVLLNKEGQFILKYKGAIDDNPQIEKNVKNNYLKRVIDEVLENKTVVSLENRATGCMIRKE